MPQHGKRLASGIAWILANELYGVILRPDGYVASEIEIRHYGANGDLAGAVHIRHIPHEKKAGIRHPDIVAVIAKALKVGTTIDWCGRHRRWCRAF